MAPPLPVIIFLPLGLDACHVVGTTCNDHWSFHVVGTICNDRWSLCNKFGWMEALQAPQRFNGKVVVEVQGARHLEAPKNLHLMVSKSRSIIAQQYVGRFAFFHVHCCKKSQENPKGPKFSILKFFIRKKCVCSIVSAGQYFSNLKGKRFKSHRSSLKRIFKVGHRKPTNCTSAGS